MTVNQSEEEQQQCFETEQSNSYPVKSVTITTCGPLYQQWASKKRMYAKMADGLTVKVDYADTLELCQSEDEPITILALHGAPGSHEDFKPFIEHFGSRNVRIIVPNYPGKFMVNFIEHVCLSANFNYCR